MTVYNLTQRVENSFETNRRLKGNLTELKRENNSSVKSVKNLEKKIKLRMKVI